MATNDFLPFAAAGGANVLSQSDWSALAARLSGYTAGVASSAQINKGLRQSAAMATMLGQFITSVGGLDALDNSDINALLANFLTTYRDQSPNYVGTVGGTSSAMVVTLSPALATHRVGLMLRIVPTAANDPGATLNAGPGALPIKRLDGSAVARGDLPGGVPSTLLCIGTAWVLAGIAYSEIPRQVTGNLTFYVRTDGNDNNDGSADTAAKAFATPQGAVNYITRTFAAGTSTATISIAAGTYPGVAVQWTPLPLQFLGTGAGLSTIINNTSTAGAALVVQSGRASAQNIQFNNSTTAFCVWAFGSGAAVTLISCGYGNSLNGSVAATFGGSVILYGSGHVINNTSNKPRFLFAESNGVLAVDTDALVTFTLVGNPGFTSAFITVAGSSSAAMVNARFSGSGRGLRYLVSRTSNINTAGGGANFFPGDTAGSADATSYGSYT
ncbi:hypothetical protein [Bosea sp. ASV33]|uniref:hypothetical protein n=1 Tax=Bosea sp. ASV33 TaxID=2795106 RepID=UPI0018ED8669|nr:hypothetical protein [Bosea sp. ASV33]